MPVVFQHHESWYGTWLSTMARKARVSVYKVCWLGGCFPSDILAAIDRAILDGVNVLSLSLGGKSSDFYRDNLAIGAFAATEKGIDRDFPAYVSLGNGKNYSGVSLYNGSSLTGTLLPFVYAANASKNTTGNFCIAGTLDPEKVAGKIILCDRGMTLNVEKGQVVKQACGAEMVLVNTAESGEELVAEAHLLPATSVSEKMGSEIKKYLLSDPNPTVTIIFEGTKVGIQPAPVVSAFSSRGPSKVAPSILKPDMIAPGVNILAGWTGAASPTGLPTDSRRPRRVQHYLWDLHVLPPHVSSLAAFIKARHSDWSPAAIRSALMTTAYHKGKDSRPLMDVATGKDATPFDFGAGHVDPKAALDPGLVYDLTADGYLDFLCALNYTPRQINLLARRNATCDADKMYSVTDLNYPSFAAQFDSTHMAGGSSVVKFSRTLTSVSGAGTYKVSISTDSKQVKVSVDTGVLSFGAANDMKSYTVTVTAKSGSPGSSSFARIVWSDGTHRVGSPMAFTWN